MFGGKDQFATLTALVEKMLELDGAAVPEDDAKKTMNTTLTPKLQQR